MIGIILGSRIGDRGHGVKSAWRLRTALWFLLLGAVSLTGAVLLPGLPVRLTLVALAAWASPAPSRT